jgi:hypothetical protein
VGHDHVAVPKSVRADPSEVASCAGESVTELLSSGDDPLTTFGDGVAFQAGEDVPEGVR